MGQKHTTMTDSATNAFPFPAVSSRDVLGEVLREGTQRLHASPK